MRRWTAGSFAAVVGCCAALVAAQDQAPRPTFTGGVDLVQIDVSVLDRDRQPVRGLTAADFTVRIDGRELPVVAFKAVDAPPVPPAPSAAWVRDVAPDVVSNASTIGRVIAIVMDDYSYSEAAIDLPGVRKAREIAHSVVDAIGPEDRAAVLFTGYGRTAQAFTSDRALLRAAIDNAPLFGSDLTPDASKERGFCYCGVCAIDAIGRVAESLRNVPELRKILIYISAGSYLEIPRWNPGKVDECLQRKRDAMHDALRQAHLANVTIQSIDPKGLLPTAGRGAGRGGVFGVPGPSAALDDTQNLRIEFLRSVAENTGGRAVVNDNDMERRVPDVLAESSSYYLIGVERPAAGKEGQLRQIDVRVNRRGVDVRTRRGYYDPTPREIEAMAAMRAAGDPTVTTLGPLPRADVSLALTAAPFAVSRDALELALSLGVSPGAGGGNSAAPPSGEVEVVAEIFNPETGESLGSDRQRVTVTWSGASAGGAYEVWSRLPAPSGRHELRVGLIGGDGRVGSVYTTVEVPTLDDDLSLSGLVIGVEPPSAAGPEGTFDGFLPIVPTTRRAFRASDTAVAYLEVYQDADAFAPTTVTTTITDAQGRTVLEERRELAGQQTDFGSGASHREVIPVQTLPAGEYLLALKVDARGKTAARHARFSIE